MDTRSPTELGRQRSTGPMLTSSEISALLAQNAENSQLLKSQNELIKTLLESQNALVNKQTALEEKINRQDQLLTKMSNHLLPEYQTPRENWYWAKEWNDGQKYDRPDGHWDAARPEKISQSDKAILDKTEELVIDNW